MQILWGSVSLPTSPWEARATARLQLMHQPVKTVVGGTCSMGTANTWKSTRHSRTLDPLSKRFAFQTIRKSLQQGTQRHKHRSPPLKKRSPIQAEITVHSEEFFAEVGSGNVMVSSVSLPPRVLLRLTTELTCSIAWNSPWDSETARKQNWAWSPPLNLWCPRINPSPSGNAAEGKNERANLIRTLCMAWYF